jgi:serine/threonine protein phosphatase 1
MAEPIANRLMSTRTTPSAQVELDGFRLPEGTLVYAVGDIHGRADLLRGTFARIDADRAAGVPPQTIEIYLGDYIDRGPASREVIDLLISRGERHATVFLKGNHEDFALQFLNTPRLFANWSKLGGLETLASYGLQPSIARTEKQQIALAEEFSARLPASHRDFLLRLQVFFSCGDFFFVHAGIRPGVALSRQREQDLIWIRDEFLTHQGTFEKMIVHGHTPVVAPEFRANRINIDTGAYATGRLTCLRIQGSRLRTLE